jgi:hypothetical protein
VTVLPVVVLLLLVWLGVWSQCRVTVDVTEPVFGWYVSRGWAHTDVNIGLPTKPGAVISTLP